MASQGYGSMGRIAGVRGRESYGQIKICGVSACVAVALGLVVLFCGSVAAVACVEVPLYANIQWSIGVRPGQWHTGDLQVCLGDKVWFKAVDDQGWEANTEDYDISTCNGEQLYDTAHYYWDYDYHGEPPEEWEWDDDDVVVSHTYSEGGTYTVYLLTHDDAGGCYVDDNDQVDPFDSVVVTVDNTPPIVAITSPTGTEWHMACVESSIWISGIAEDPEIGILDGSVDIKIGEEAPWTDVDCYNTDSHVWFHEWHSPPSGNTTIYVRATNNCGNSTTISPVVTVTWVSVMHVSKSGNDYSGTTWALAWTAIQAGISSSIAHTEVWVAAGEEYTGAISLANGVAVYGGFRSCQVLHPQTVREQRDWKANECVISIAENTTASVVTAGETCISTDTRLDGFTIQNGTGRDDYWYQCGGGIFCEAGARPVITNNVIRENSAGYGGGIYCLGDDRDEPSATITNNVIANNTGAQGPGIDACHCAPTITNNTIVYNGSSDYETGAIHCYDANATIANNIIAFNTADYATANYAVYASNTCTPTLANNCIFPYDVGYFGVSAGASDTWINPRLTSDCHLQRYSPCIGAGYNGADELPSIDMDGQPRIQPADDPNAKVDIGADESEWSAPVIPPGMYRVGFLYDLCYSNTAVDTRAYIDEYLSRIDEEHDVNHNVLYDRIGDIEESGIDDSFNVVFVALPLPDHPTQAECEALDAFLDSGRQKRVVLIGDYSAFYWTYNERLNSVAQALGMSATFNTRGWGEDLYDYDLYFGYDRHCAVDQSHYLITPDVSYLWDASTSVFEMGSGASWLAHTVQAPALAWIVEDDTAAAGSIVAIHDSSLMHPAYNDEHDTPVPCRNFKFVHNLCTIFPQ